MIVVLLGVSALTAGSDLLGIVILAAVPVIVIAALGWAMAQRTSGRRRYRVTMKLPNGETVKSRHTVLSVCNEA